MQSDKDVEPLFFRYWGKAGADDSYHLLPYHCLDVAAVGFHLLSPKQQRCQSLAKSLGVDAHWLQQWFTFCLALHDLGKFTAAFQNLVPDIAKSLGSFDPACDGRVRHDALGYGLWIYQLKELIPSPYRTRAEQWLGLVFGHHGQPVDNAAVRKAVRSHCNERDEQAARRFAESIIKHFMPPLEPLEGVDTEMIADMERDIGVDNDPIPAA